MTAILCRIGLIVTGKGEEAFLHELFNREMRPHANCLFEIIRYFPQLRPTKSKATPQFITGTPKPAPTRDQELGLAVLGYLRQHQQGFVVFVDDLEGDDPEPVFHRYRNAIDGVIKSQGLDRRAAVHFLANMIEAYYFAQSTAVNTVAGRKIIERDHPTDVEKISHPKEKLKKIWHGFKEIEHGREITRILNLQHVLKRPGECCWLRGLLSWCVDKLQMEGAFYKPMDPKLYFLDSGCKSPLCYPQLPQAKNPPGIQQL